jgi:hypothetical protein
VSVRGFYLTARPGLHARKYYGRAGFLAARPKHGAFTPVDSVEQSRRNATFDITDGGRIVFDRSLDDSDVLLVDLATKKARP